MKFPPKYTMVMGLLGLGILLSLLTGIKQSRQLNTQLGLWQEHQTNMEKLKDAPAKVHLQRERLEQMGNTLDSLRQKGIGIGSQTDFPVYLQDLCQRFSVRLIRFPSESAIEGDLQVLQFSLEGSFAALLQLIYQLEQVDRVGQIRTLHLHTQSLAQKGRKVQVLLARLSLQKISSP